MIQIPIWLFWLLVTLPVVLIALRIYAERRQWVMRFYPDDMAQVKAGYNIKRTPDGSWYLVRGWWGRANDPISPRVKPHFTPGPQRPPPGKPFTWQPPKHEAWRWDPVQGWLRLGGYQPAGPDAASNPPSGGSSVQMMTPYGLMLPGEYIIDQSALSSDLGKYW